MTPLQNKTEKEKEIISYMLQLYCKRTHCQCSLCRECADLLAYAHERIDACPRKETKTFCSVCSVHCYRKEMRERIRVVMRFSGPCMLLHHPLLTLKHLYIEKKEKRL